MTVNVPASTSLVLRPRGVFLDPPGAVVADCAVVVEGRRITFVGAPDEAARLAPTAATVDLADATLLPGLINTHVHLSFTGSRDPRTDFHADQPETRLARAIHHAQVMLRSGVTTVRDCGSDWSLLALQQISDTGLFTLPNMMLCGPPITPTLCACALRAPWNRPTRASPSISTVQTMPNNALTAALRPTH